MGSNDLNSGENGTTVRRLLLAIDCNRNRSERQPPWHATLVAIRDSERQAQVVWQLWGEWHGVTENKKSSY